MSYLSIRPGNPGRYIKERLIPMKPFSISVSRGEQLKLVLFGACVIGVLATMTGRGTLAYFTTQTTSTGNSFTAGTLHLQATDLNEGPSPSVSTSISFSN